MRYNDFNIASAMHTHTHTRNARVNALLSMPEEEQQAWLDSTAYVLSRIDMADEIRVAMRYVMNLMASGDMDIDDARDRLAMMGWQLTSIWSA